MDKTARMKELIPLLNEAAKAYYQEDREIMSNFDYDKLYDELVLLERETGITLTGSPTAMVGYEALDELQKEAHESPMLSLDKTKDVETLREFIGDQKTLLSWKLDGLTIVLTYRDGSLSKAVTRGNGVVGEVITNNAMVFKNIPLQIAHKGELILRGEAIITYSDFEKINEQIEDVDARYKNPRNLCSGSVRQLNNEITAKRNVQFYAFSLVRAEGVDFENSRQKQFEWLAGQGFDVVEYRMVTADTLDDAIAYFSDKITRNDFPSDGLVALYDDIAYGDSLGSTAKFPRNAFAFKWKDEIRETTLKEIEWSPSRTGLINPVAVFEPVELEGTTVSRASVHNISILKELELGIGDKIQVYKANMIIPQIAENLTRSGDLEIPHVCPVCGQEARVVKTNGVESLYCMNTECQAKRIKSFTLFVSRDAMNIDGLSEATLEKFILKGFIKDFGDIFEIEKYRDEIVSMEGFGQKSYDNLIASIEKASHTTLPRLLYSLGISNVGIANAKMICKEFRYDLGKIIHATPEEISSIEGIGPVIAGTFTEYFADEDNMKRLEHLLSHLTFEEVKTESTQSLEGKQFVITGSVEHFANRSQLKEYIE
ncbi:NAD-dependent DNA ligase LigA, partial [Blautia sp.]